MSSRQVPDDQTVSWTEIERLFVEAEELQRKKVVELARRLHPGLTEEDIRNPHDFPDLNDPDWHYEDGILTGIQAMMTSLRALRRQMPR